ncbi:hypothetical protein [Lacrimispora sp. 210928-DFI.3.58]|uniref:hypothetical protein n=1 Tax=Lacrimispora sp. 210928-DFI.3.58 TaxID=2883214 RepID=UPI001D065E8D|nr:hypothetical protein [Lacrimispora sp. 210928-DFI.3.58]MCB7320463.1 hypothetical protein [Lacrimispora sp. 210928-DFI.3.58]
MGTEKTKDLLKLLSRCLPDNQALKHDALIESIMMMPEYQELAHRSTYQPIYDDFYAPKVLDKLSLEQLEQVENIIPLLLECLQNIIFSIQNGAGPFLNKEDTPDFYDIDSISKLQKTLTLESHPNYTNITAENFMAIFSNDTLKSGQAIFNQLDADEKDINAGIQRLLKGKYYCISKDEMAQLESQYQSELKLLKANGTIIRKGWLGRIVKRIACAIFVSMLPSTVGMATGMMNNSMIAISSLLVMILSLVFVIGG